MPDEFARAFRFRVTLNQSPAGPGTGGGTGPVLGGGAFQECTGLDLEMDVAEYVEGGRNDGVVQRAGRVKLARITLRRGMLHPAGGGGGGGAGGGVDGALWRWFADVVDGVRPLRRYDGTIQLLDGRHQPVGGWKFVRGLPAKLVGPALNGRTGEIAIEELQIAHEGLRLEVP
ncbi:phage tail protein [Nonomuraea sp. PA05]|uniref:phage tail protein n=1 Tax=Nonomuraea sp. PA05 TaxID=2604466 RepID=UPI0011D4C576|nr:phage tail protein [Nonomuraea sp. PA05]TYB64795.1 phage tail protein [Nonomuraea sp. PA05]